MFYAVQTSQCHFHPCPGGLNDATDYNSSEIFDVENQSWRSGPRLPNDIRDPASVQVGESFLLVGGSCHLGDCSHGQVSNKIYEFNPYIQDWEERGEKLTGGGRYMAGAVVVDKSLVQCNPSVHLERHGGWKEKNSGFLNV